MTETGFIGKIITDSVSVIMYLIRNYHLVRKVYFLTVGIPFDVGSNAFALENDIMMSFSRIMNTLRINAYGVGIRFKIAFLFAFVADVQNTFYALLTQVGN